MILSSNILHRIDPIVRKLSGDRLYTSYEIDEKEFVGKIALPESYEMESFLKQNGYENIWFEATKTHPETGETHELSMRKTHGMMDTSPYTIRGTGLREYDFRQRQWHVHGFRVDGYMEFYSHYELRGDPWPIGSECISEAIRRMRSHYRPTWDRDIIDRSKWTYLRGVADPALAGVID